MIAFLLMLAAVIAGAEFLSLRRGLGGVEYDLRLSKTIAEPDEPLQLISVITNRRRRILSFLRLNENVPDALNVEGELRTESVSQRRSALRSTVYMMPRQRLTRRTPFTAPRRGRYLFLGATLEGGDFMGLSTASRQVELLRELVILPRRVEAARIQQLMGGWMGDRSVNRFIMEDPVLTLGYRDYTGREPMKQIAWTQTARLGRMMVRCQDYTVERTVTVMLNANTFAFGSYGARMLEAALALCRGVCEALEEQRIPYAFISNARCLGMPDGFGEVGDGLGKAHLATVLEGLGRADSTFRDTLEGLFDRALSRAAVGRGHIFITPVRNDLHPELLQRLRAATGEAPLSITGEDLDVELPGDAPPRADAELRFVPAE